MHPKIVESINKLEGGSLHEKLLKIAACSIQPCRSKLGFLLFGRMVHLNAQSIEENKGKIKQFVARSEDPVALAELLANEIFKLDPGNKKLFYMGREPEIELEPNNYDNPLFYAHCTGYWED